MPQPALVEELASELVDAYVQIWDMLVEEFETLSRPEQWRRRRRIRELLTSIDAEFEKLEVDTERFVRRELREIYGLGADAAGLAVTPTLQRTSALASLERELKKELLQAATQTQTRAKALIQEAARVSARKSVIEGTPAEAAARFMSDTLADNGLHAVRYADGSMHSLREYSRVAIRSVTAVAYNEGTIAQAVEYGIKYFEILDGTNCGLTSHDDAQKVNGLVVPEEQAREYLISHPNCRRSFSPRPDVTDPDNLEDTQLGQYYPTLHRERKSSTSDPRGYRALRDMS